MQQIKLDKGCIYIEKEWLNRFQTAAIFYSLTKMGPEFPQLTHDIIFSITDKSKQLLTRWMSFRLPFNRNDASDDDLKRKVQDIDCTITMKDGKITNPPCVHNLRSCS